uniref:Uncharacterized protein n=1 Tax=Timema poppense TaxID=170557 RepID=A0A7R9DSN0_TIMPO|nr:unnamed protein product [Timema poppensis]
MKVECVDQKEVVDHSFYRKAHQAISRSFSYEPFPSSPLPFKHLSTIHSLTGARSQLTGSCTPTDEIVASTGNQDVLVRKLDLASLSSVREFSKQILESEPRLDVLVNNAGVAGIDKIMTEDNLVLGMQANHFAPFLLTNLLAGIDTRFLHDSILASVAGLLKESAPSRIVNVSSLMHKYCKLDLENLNCEKSFNKTDVYSVSKLNNILMTSELSRRLQGTGVTANSLHPGVIKTEIMRQMSPLMLAVTNFFMGIFAKVSSL